MKNSLADNSRKEKCMRWLYINNDDNSMRFVLGLEKEKRFPEKSLLCIGVNPSTATPDQPDATIRNVIKLAQNNGYDNFYMMNLYPQRARDYRSMDEEIDKEKHISNLNWFHNVIEGYRFLHNKGIDIWCAWGNMIEAREYLKETCLKDIYMIAKNNGCDFYSIGQVSIAGNPHHPLYIKSDTLKQPYDLSHYFS